MRGAEIVLELSRVLVALGVAVFVGGPLARVLGRRKIFLEGEGGESEGDARARFVAAGCLLVGVLLEVQVLGSALPARHVWRTGVLFVLVASLVYSVMVVAPRARYYDERSSTFEENLRTPWLARRDATRARGRKINLFTFVLALAALVLG